MTPSTVIRPQPSNSAGLLVSGSAVMLRGSKSAASSRSKAKLRARHTRFAPQHLSMALASAFNAASLSLSQTIAGLSISLAGLANAQTQPNPNLPQGGVAVHGTAAIVQNGTTLNVNTTNGAGNRSIINWQSFNIGAGHTTNINQPNAQSSSLNRVISNTPSQIYGTLRSNGQVILVNQNGIAVGAGGVVDTAGFTASTLNITDADYKAKRLRFEGNALSGGVVLEGEDRSDPNNIRPGAMVRSSNGDVMLFAPNVTVGKDAKVKVDNGNVIVGAGQAVEVTGRGLEGVKFLIQGTDHKAINLGTLQGNAVGVFAGTLRHSGVIQAQQATMEGGRVVLRAIKDIEIVKDASLAHAPIISANGGVNAQGIAQSGGNVRIESSQGNIIIGTGAQISANAGSSAAGQNLTPNQQIALVNAAGGAITIIANEGRVITEAGSQISATGSPGGIIKIYGGQEARVASVINASSPSLGAADAAGTLQLINAANGNALMGGTIQILSPELVHLATGAQLLASGDAGGGTILVGGDYQGANAAITNAQNTNVSSAVLLEANARVNGNGGKVIVWADNDTYFAGTLHAKGGEQGGDGGFGETSGKKNLYFRGRADLSARRGRTGTLLLDPQSLTINGGTGTSDDGNSDGINTSADEGGNLLTNYTIYEGAIETLGATANVILEASGNINFQGTFGGDGLSVAKSLTIRTRNSAASLDPVVGGISLAGWGNTGSFTISAAEGLLIDAGSGYTGLALNAPSIFSNSSTDQLSLVSSSGNIQIRAAGSIQLGSGATISAPSGQVSIESKLSDISLGGISFGGAGISAKAITVQSKGAGSALALDGGVVMNASAGQINLIADRLLVDTASSGMVMTASDGINIYPNDLSRTIRLGGNDLTISPFLGISQAEWSQLRGASTSTVRVGDNSAYVGNIVIEESGGFNLGFNNAALLTIAGSITQTTGLSANKLRMEAGSITLGAGGSNNFNQLAATSISGGLSLSTGSSNVFVTTVDGLSGLHSATTLSFNNTNLASTNLYLDGGNISTQGNISILNFDTLSVYSGAQSIDSNSDNLGNSGSINLSGALIQGNAPGVLTLDSSSSNATAGSISLGNVVTNTISQNLGGLIINSTGFDQANDGNISLPSTVIVGLSGLLTNGRVMLTQDSSITALNNGQVTLQGEVQGNKNFSINADGQVNLQAEMGTGTQIANVDVISNNVITVSNRIRSGSNIGLTANGAGSINMTSLGEIEGVGTGAGLTISLFGQGGVQLSKITANSDYAANVQVGTAGAAISSVTSTLVNFSGGLGSITLGSSLTPGNIGTTAIPIKLESAATGTEIYAFGKTDLHLVNISSNFLRLEDVQVDPSSSTANLSVRSVGDLLVSNVAVGSGNANISLQTDNEFSLSGQIAGSGASNITLSAGTVMNLGEGSNAIFNANAVYLQGSGTQAIDFVDVLPGTLSAGTLYMLYGEMDAIGPSVTHVVVGRTDQMGGNIRFAGTQNFNPNAGSKNYSFFSGGAISSTTNRSIELDAVGLSAGGNIALSNVDIKAITASTGVNLAAKSSGSIDLRVNDADGVTLTTVGAILPAGERIHAIETTGTANISLSNATGGIFSGTSNFDVYAGAGLVTLKAYQDIGTTANPVAIHASGFTLGNEGGGVFQNLIAVALTRNSSSTVQTSNTVFDTGNQAGDNLYLAAGVGTTTLELNDTFATGNVINRTLANSGGDIRLTQPNAQFSGTGSFSFNANSTSFETITTIAAGHTVNITGDSTITAGTGWLQGSGMLNNVGYSLLNNGTISPGSNTAMGTLTVQGGVTLGSTGRLDMQINTTATDGDRLVVGGAFNAGGGTLAVSENSLASTNISTTYTLATIGGAATGTFGSVISPFADFTSALTAGPGGLLTVTPLSIVNSWTNSAGGTWNVATNWSRNVVPTSSHNAVIDMVGFNPVVTLNTAGAARALIVGNSDTILLQNTLTLGAGGAIVNSGATMNLTVGGSSAILSASDISINAGGTLNWSGGVIGSATDTTQSLNTAGVVNISGPGSSYQDIYRNWINTGVVNWTGGRFTELVNNANGVISFTNASTGQINLNTTFAGTDDFINGGLGSFVNQGTITSASSLAATTTRLNVTQNGFQNTGTIFSNAGTLSIGSSGTLTADTGDYTVAAGAGLAFTASRFFNAGASVEGAGLLKISGGPITMGAGVGLGVLTNGSVSLGAQLNLNTGVAQTINTLSMGGAAVLFSGDAVNVGSLTAAAGRFEGSGLFTTTGASSITDNFERNGGQWQNAGVMTVSGANGTLYLNNNATLTNAAAGQINYTGSNATALYEGTGANRFVNQGTITNGAGATLRAISAPFDNSGSVRVTNGILQISSAGAETGGYTVASGAGLNLNTARNFTSVSSGSGLFGLGSVQTSAAVTLSSGVATDLLRDGSLTVASSSLTLNTGSGWTFANSVALNGGTINHANAMTGAIKVSGNALLTSSAGGTVWTLPTLTTSTLSMGSGVTFATSNSVLENYGTLNFTGDGALSLGNSLTNQGTVSLTGNGTISGVGTFNNTSAGTVNRTTSANTFSINSGFAQGGVLNANSGTLAFGNALTNSGLIQGTARINVGGVGLTNGVAGTIAPGAIGTIGTLTLGGNANLTNGNLRFDLDSASNDQLAITGSVTLGAALKVSEIGTGVLVGNSYSLLTYGGSAINSSALDSTAITDVSFAPLAPVLGAPNALVTSVTGITNRFSNSAVSDDWNTAANWTRGHVPTVSEDVIIDVTQTNKQVTINSAGGVARSIALIGDDDLHINNGKALTVAGSSFSTIGSGGATLFLDGGSFTQASTGGELSVLTDGKVVSSGVSSVSLSIFDNAGAVQVVGGTLSLGADGSDIGASYTIAGGSNLWLTKGDRYLGNSMPVVNDGILSIRGTGRLFLSGDGSNFTGAGTLEAHSGTLRMSGFNGSINNLSIASAGTLSSTSGTDSLIVTNSFSANGGTISGSGLIITAGTSTVTGSLALDGGFWENSGSLIFTASGPLDAIQVLNGATFTNTSSGYITGNALQNFAIFEGATLSASGTVVNQGTIELTGLSGDTHFLDVHQFENTGTLRLGGGARYVLTQSSFDQQGVLALAGNSILGVLGLNNTGTIEGIGTIDLAGGNLVNTGTLAPGDDGGVSSIGTLTVMGNLTMGNASKQRFDLELGGSDRIHVNGDLNFSGSTGPQMILNELNPPSFLGGELVTLISATGAFNVGTAEGTSGSSDVTFRGASDTVNKVYTAQVIGIYNAWINDAGGQWTTVGNWSRGAVPNSYHDVTIDPSNPTGRVTITGGTNALARSLRIGENHFGNELYINGASGANLLVNNAAEVSSSTELVRIYSGSTLQIVGGGTLALGHGYMEIDAGAEYRGISSTLSAYSGATGNATIHNNGLMTNTAGTGRWGLSAGLNTLDFINDTGGTLSAASGTIQIDTAQFTQDGLINLGSSGNFRQLNADLENNGIINFSGGTIDNGSNTLLNFGQINGHGTITVGLLDNYGMIDIGLNPNTAQTIRVNGNFANDSSGQLLISAPANGAQDALEVIGSANLSGTIDFTATNGHAFGSSQGYTPVTASVSTNGSFTSATGFGLLQVAQNNSSGAAFSLSLASGQIEWIGTDGNWNNSANWKDSTMANRLPIAGDTVLINPAGAKTITVSSATDFTVLNLAQNDDTIFITTGGTLTLLGGDTLAGTLHVSGGTLTNAGANTLTSAANRILVDSGKFNVNANLDVSFLTLNNTATNAMTISAGSTLSLLNGGNSFLNSSVFGSGSIVNASGGYLSIDGASVTPHLENFGSIDVFGSTTLSSFSAPVGSALWLNGNGTLVHTAGSLSIDGFLGGSGTLDIGAGNLLTVNSTGTVNPGSTSTTQGKLHVIGHADFSSALLAFDVQSASISDQIFVTGSASLPTNIHVNEVLPVVEVGQTYSLVSAGSLTGAATGVSFFTGGVGNSDVEMTTSRPAGTSLVAEASSVINRWTSLSDGSWTVAANWSRSHVPTMTEDVVIAPVGSKTISLTAASGQARSLTMLDTDDTLAIAGTFINAATLTVENEFQSNGTVQISGTVANAGNLYTGNTNPDDTSISVLRMQGKSFLIANGDIFTQGATIAAASGLSPQIQGNGWYMESGEHVFQGVGNIDFSGTTLYNESLATVSIASGLMVFGAGVLNQGTINIATGSTLSLAAGTSFFNEKVLEGVGTVQVNGSGSKFQNEITGIIRPSGSGIGEITLTAASGGQIYLDAGIAEIQLTNSSSYDKIKVNGPLNTTPAFSVVLSETSPFLMGGEVFQPLSFSSSRSGGLPNIDSTSISGKSFALTEASAFGSALTLTASGGFTTDIFWDGGGDGLNWSDKFNWSTDLLPVANQKVTINPAGSGSVTLSSGTYSGFIGLELPDFSDQLFITGGSLALPVTNLTLNSTVHLQGGTLVGNSAGGIFANNFNWSGGTFSGAGTYTASSLSLAGGGARVLNGVTLNAGATTLNGGSLVLQSGGLFSTGSSGMLITGSGTLAFAGGNLSTTGLTNDGLVRIDSGTVSLNNTAIQTGDFTIASGANLSFANDATLSAAASVLGGSWAINNGKTVTTQGGMNRGAGGVTFVNGDLNLGGDFETEQLIMLAGGDIAGGGKVLRVTQSWNDLAIGAGSITGLASATITQATGNLSFNKNLATTGNMELAATTGDILSGANTLAAGLGGQVKLVAGGLIDANVQAGTVHAVSSGSNIVLDINGPTQIAALSTAAGKTATLTTNNSLGQAGAINTAGGIVLNAGTSDVAWVNPANTFGQGVRSVSANLVQIISNSASPMSFSGSANQVQLGGGAVQLGDSVATLNVSGPLTVVASGNITQGAALNITGLTSLTSTSGNIVMNTASSYGGGLSFSGSNVQAVANGPLMVRGEAGGTLNLSSTGNLTQFGAGIGDRIVAAGLATLTATGASITFGNTNNNFNSLRVVANQADIADLNAIAIEGNVSGAFALLAGGDVSSSGLLTANSLQLTAAGGSPIQVALSNTAIGIGGASFVNVGNGYSSISYTNAGAGSITSPIMDIAAGGFFSYTQTGAAVLPSIMADSVTVSATGPISQTGGVSAPVASFSAPGQTINLGNAGNTFGMVDAAGAGITLRSSATLDPNINASGAVALDAPGINQTSGRGISAPSLVVTSTGAIGLFGANNVAAFSGTAGAGVQLNNSHAALAVGNVTAGAGQNLVINNAGGMTQQNGTQIVGDEVDLQANALGSSAAPMQLNAARVRLNASTGDAFVTNTQSSELLGAGVAGALNYSAVGLDIEIGGANTSAVNVNAGNGITLLGADITISGGTAVGASTTVNGNAGGVSITTSGNFVLQGGTASGAHARVDAIGPVNVLVGGTLNVTGGMGATAYARLDPSGNNPMNISASSINLTGGSGAGSYAAIASDGNITVNTSSLSMQSGSGVDADAVIISNFGFVTAPSCNGCVELNGMPLVNGTNEIGFYNGGRIIGQSNSSNQIVGLIDQINDVINPEPPLRREDERDAEPDIVIDGQCP